MSFFVNCLKGIALGAGAILPGISSGVLCVIFGFYEKLINSILAIFKDFKNSFKFLLPIFIGGFIGVLLFGNALKYLFFTYPSETNFAFMGLILGSVPILFKNSCKKNTFKLHYLIYTLASFLLTLLLINFENGFDFQGTIANTFSFSYLILCGFIMSTGIVVPGVSSTVILMCLGVYSNYLSAVACLNLEILIPMGIGLILGGVIWMVLIKWLFSKYYTQTFFTIIGFVISSTLILYPGFSISLSGIISIVLFIICFGISFNLEKISK